MSYIRHIWAALEMITKDGLNHMEEGIEANDQAIESLDSAIESGEFLTNASAAPAIVCAPAQAAAVSFGDGAANLPLKKCVIHLLPVQAGSGDASPTNIRPLSGHTSAQLTHNGQNVEVSFLDSAGSVFGGELDVLTGKLTVYGGTTTVGALNWEYYEDTGVFRAVISGKTNSYDLLLCSAYKTVDTNLAAADMPDLSFKEHYGTASTYRNVVYIKDARFTTPEALVEAVGSQTITYRLRVPNVYNLTPEQILTLLGTNNFSSTSGTLEIEYIADTKLYTNGGAGDSMTAANNISSGKYFQVGNALYKATAAIAKDETIVPGTNCTAINLADALNELAQ